MKYIFIFISFLVTCSMLSCDYRNTQAIKVMTFNIRYGTAEDGQNSWENRKSILIDCLKKYQPEILGTQESLDFQIEFIKAAFPEWQVFGVGRYHDFSQTDRPHESMGGESCKVFYDPKKLDLIKQGTYWHSDTPDVPASRTWGNDLPRITTWGLFHVKNTGQQFVVMNTHFHWDEPYVSNTTKLIMQKWREIADSSPTILMGDFNLEPTSETHSLFCGKIGREEIRGNFNDCWQVLAKPEVNAGTSHRFNGSRSRGRIDWILVTPEFDVRSTSIIYYNDNGRYPSDHYPVLARLRLHD